MANMKCEQKKIEEVCAVNMTHDEYPYGLRIHLEPEVVQKLKMKMPAVGEKFELTGMAIVKSVSAETEREGKERISCSLQITDLEVLKKSNASKKLYGED
jgi:hypothetical protein